MRLTRPRFTVRRLMITVALVGLVCGVEICRRRREILVARSNIHTLKENFYKIKHIYDLANIGNLENDKLRKNYRKLRGGRLRDSANPKDLIEEARRRSESSAVAARYHAQLREKYIQAARYPWLPVEPDPPEPE